MSKIIKDSRKIKGSKIFDEFEPYMVSLTEPYQHNYTLEGVKCSMPAGGLTAALDPVLKKYGGTWIASGTGDADWKYVDENNRINVPPEDPKYTLRRIKFTKSEYQKFYYGFNHQTFWPLLHKVFHRPDFDHDMWEGFVKANRHFAEAILEEINEKEKSFVWLQDFQLSLVSKMMTQELSGSNVKITQFWHVPWPSPESFYRCPWGEEIFEGLLGNHVIGFHLDRYAKNFMKTAQKLPETEVDFENHRIERGGRETFVVHSPISVDYEKINRSAREKNVENKIREFKKSPFVANKVVGLGIDRLDYSKGIPERLEAVEKFLEKYPEYHNEFVFIQAGAPLLSRVPDYRKLSQKVETMIDEINMKFEEDEWKPLLFFKEKLDHQTLRALQRIADLYIVSSLHDGMNIVAKENIAADIEKTGVLILSEFTGAAEELKNSIQINPYDQLNFIKAIKKAIEMPPEEKEKRMEKMQNTVKNHTIQDWLTNIIEEMGTHALNPD